MTQQSSLTPQAQAYTNRAPSFDPYSREFTDNPYVTYATLRERGPVLQLGESDASRLLPAWVFAHSEAVALFTDNRIQREPVTSASETVDSNAKRSEYAKMIGHWMLFQDPPSHCRQRGSLGRIFTPPVVAAMRNEIEQIVSSRIDNLLRLDTVDMIRDFAQPLPVQVIASLLGMPKTECSRFKRWSTTLSDAIDLRPDSKTLAAAEETVLEAKDYFAYWARERRNAPRDDLLTRLVSQTDMEAGLTEDEVFATFTLLLTAGHETTTNLIGNGLHALMSNPDQLQLLRENPQHMRTAIDEFLRYESPVQITSRIVAEKLEIGGCALHPGQRVLIVIGSANHDEKIFANPDELDVTRTPNPHLTFGMGSHYCAGAPLARMQGAIAITALLQRAPKLRRASDSAQWRPNASFRGLLSLDVQM